MNISKPSRQLLETVQRGFAACNTVCSKNPGENGPVCQLSEDHTFDVIKADLQYCLELLTEIDNIKAQMAEICANQRSGLKPIIAGGNESDKEACYLNPNQRSLAQNMPSPEENEEIVQIPSSEEESDSYAAIRGDEMARLSPLPGLPDARYKSASPNSIRIVQRLNEGSPNDTYLDQRIISNAHSTPLRGLASLSNVNLMDREMLSSIEDLEIAMRDREIMSNQLDSLETPSNRYLNDPNNIDEQPLPLPDNRELMEFPNANLNPQKTVDIIKILVSPSVDDSGNNQSQILNQDSSRVQTPENRYLQASANSRRQQFRQSRGSPTMNLPSPNPAERTVDIIRNLITPSPNETDNNQSPSRLQTPENRYLQAPANIRRQLFAQSRGSPSMNLPSPNPAERTVDIIRTLITPSPNETDNNQSQILNQDPSRLQTPENRYLQASANSRRQQFAQSRGSPIMNLPSPNPAERTVDIIRTLITPSPNETDNNQSQILNQDPSRLQTPENRYLQASANSRRQQFAQSRSSPIMNLPSPNPAERTVDIIRNLVTPDDIFVVDDFGGYENIGPSQSYNRGRPFQLSPFVNRDANRIDSMNNARNLATNNRGRTLNLSEIRKMDQNRDLSKVRRLMGVTSSSYNNESLQMPTPNLGRPFSLPRNVQSINENEQDFIDDAAACPYRPQNRNIVQPSMSTSTSYAAFPEPPIRRTQIPQPPIQRIPSPQPRIEPRIPTGTRRLRPTKSKHRAMLQRKINIDRGKAQGRPASNMAFGRYVPPSLNDTTLPPELPVTSRRIPQRYRKFYKPREAPELPRSTRPDNRENIPMVQNTQVQRLQVPNEANESIRSRLFYEPDASSTMLPEISMRRALRSPSPAPAPQERRQPSRSPNRAVNQRNPNIDYLQVPQDDGEANGTRRYYDSMANSPFLPEVPQSRMLQPNRARPNYEGSPEPRLIRRLTPSRPPNRTADYLQVPQDTNELNRTRRYDEPNANSTFLSEIPQSRMEQPNRPNFSYESSPDPRLNQRAKTRRRPRIANIRQEEESDESNEGAACPLILNRNQQHLPLQNIASPRARSPSGGRAASRSPRPIDREAYLQVPQDTNELNRTRRYYEPNANSTFLPEIQQSRMEQPNRPNFSYESSPDPRLNQRAKTRRRPRTENIRQEEESDENIEGAACPLILNRNQQPQSPERVPASAAMQNILNTGFTQDQILRM